jgi:uncharacterized protein (TIGR02611 family)
MSVQFKDTVAFIGRSAKRVAVAVIGGALVVAGLVLMVLPGPGLLVIALGFAVLATEFAWAHHVLEVGKAQTTRAVNTAKGAARRITRR